MSGSATTRTTRRSGESRPPVEITEFGGIPPREFPILEGPTPGPDRNLWFSANEPTAAVERISSEGTITRFVAGLDRHTEYVGPFVTGSDGNVWFRVEKSASRRRRNPDAGTTAIGRIAPSGKISEFSHCLRPLPLVRGPELPHPRARRERLVHDPAVGRIQPSHPPLRFPQSAASPRAGRSPNSATAWTNKANPKSSPPPAAASGSSTACSTRSARSPRPAVPPTPSSSPFRKGTKGSGSKSSSPSTGSVRIQETGVVTQGHRKAVPGLVSTVAQRARLRPGLPAAPLPSRAAAAAGQAAPLPVGASRHLQTARRHAVQRADRDRAGAAVSGTSPADVTTMALSGFIGPASP